MRNKLISMIGFEPIFTTPLTTTYLEDRLGYIDIMTHRRVELLLTE